MNKWPWLEEVKYFQTWQYRYVNQSLRCISSFICNHLRWLSHILNSGISSNFYFLFPRPCLLCILSSLAWSSWRNPYLCVEAQPLLFISCITPKTTHRIRRILATFLSSILCLSVIFISNHIETPNFFLV